MISAAQLHSVQLSRVEYKKILGDFIQMECAEWRRTDELTDQQEKHGNEEGEHVATIGFTVLAIAFGEVDQSGIDAINAQGLNQSWN